MISFILSSILLVSNIADPDGWAVVEKEQVYSEEVQDEDRGEWVVFSKWMDQEKFLVRLPDDPSYRYFEGGMQIESREGSDDFRLRIEKRVGGEIESYFQDRIEEIENQERTFLYKVEQNVDGNGINLLYFSEDQWVRESIKISPHFLYTFSTISSDMSGAKHQKFIDSFDVKS